MVDSGGVWRRVAEFAGKEVAAKGGRRAQRRGGHPCRPGGGVLVCCATTCLA